MKIKILTLFPQMFDGFKDESIIKRAIAKGVCEIEAIDIRDYSLSKHRHVDDTPCGGGAGMVLQVDVIDRCIKANCSEDSFIVMMTPQGKRYDQATAMRLSKLDELVILCGHYEGFDERIRTLADIEISIGDFVLTGGEIPAMAISDSIIRLLDGVIQEKSHIEESFNDNLLDYPVYTHPVEYKGMKVPNVLLSGHHANINKWRKEESIKRTQERRPDLLGSD